MQRWVLFVQMNLSRIFKNSHYSLKIEIKRDSKLDPIWLCTHTIIFDFLEKCMIIFGTSIIAIPLSGDEITRHLIREDGVCWYSVKPEKGEMDLCIWQTFISQDCICVLFIIKMFLYRTEMVCDCAYDLHKRMYECRLLFSYSRSSSKYNMIPVEDSGRRNSVWEICRSLQTKTNMSK